MAGAYLEADLFLLAVGLVVGPGRLAAGSGCLAAGLDVDG